MLILSRKPDEAIVLHGAKPDDEISFDVLSVKGKQVRIGVTAPKHVTVHRGEIQDKIDREKQVDLELVQELRAVHCG